MAQIRVRGYIVGFDVRNNGAVDWTVRIHEPGHPFNEKKYEVGSFHPGMHGIKAGTNVTFFLGEKNGSFYNMALDVRRENAPHPQCACCDEEADALFRYSEMKGSLTSSFKATCLAHCPEIGDQLVDESSGRSVDVKNLWKEDDDWRPW